MKLPLLGSVVALVAAVAGTALVEEPSNVSAPPKVDLGYAVHQAIVNETKGFYSFNNIRYGDSTAGFRFQPSVAVSTTDRTVNDGLVGFKCPQAYPEWALRPLAAASGLTTQQMLQVVLDDPTISEDCLFLDIVTPKKAFDLANGAPVIVWLYGGGYVFGHKNEDVYNPSGLIARSQADGSDGIIYVAINYRVGMFGWLNGDGDKKITPNVGLYDQALALDWIKANIHHFGGDPEEVTVMGQSAGAGSIIHHITARGGITPAPFRRAIVQSPGWENINVTGTWNITLAMASALAGRVITSGKDLVALDFTTLNQINSQIVFGSVNGSFTYSPTVDKEYVPDHPETLLLQGKFDSKPHVMIGHNSNEAGLFVSPELDTEEELVSDLGHVFQDFLADSVQYILTDLYPSPQNTDLYKTQYERASLIVSESAFVCNTRYLAAAFNNQTVNYRFQVPPAVHAQDLPWTFYHGNAKDVVPALAETMQLYFTSFTKTGSPNSEYIGLPKWPEYGDKAQIVTFGAGGVSVDEDDAKNERCVFWQTGEYRK